MQWILWLLLAALMLIRPAGVLAVDEQNVIQQWQVDRKWIGDFDGMTERRLIRVLVVHNKMMFFFDKGRIRGLTHEAIREFETYINEKLKTGTRKIKVVFLPVPRNRLLPWLIEGRGDIAAANLTITEGREKAVDFSLPAFTGVEEILVTGPAAPPVETLNQLSGKEIHTRRSSSYFEHLKRLNSSFEKQGKEPVTVVAASEYMEDADLLEMVNAGLIPMVIVDNHKARFWAQIFDKITLHPDISVNTDGDIAWALRKNSPKLKQVLDEFIKKHKKGTLLGNVLFRRYLVKNKWARNSLSPEELAKFQNLVTLFRTYSDKYDFDYLMMAAVAYQESQLDHAKRSPAGAVGIMQLLPSTAADKNVAIPEIEILENNIHAGIKYLRFLRNRYFSDPAIDALNQNLFTFAAYNAGPAKIRRLRAEAETTGLDPNVWFGNVEVVAARKIGRETVQYVGNIYKYYLAYRLVRNKQEAGQIQTGASRGQGRSNGSPEPS